MNNTLFILFICSLILVSCTLNTTSQLGSKNSIQSTVAKTAELNGTLCFPADYIPSMTIYLKQINTAQLYKQTTTKNQRYFKFTNIPFGEYCAYAYTIDKIETNSNGVTTKACGAYTKAVPCGLLATCTDHTLIKFKIDTATSKDTISICDFYGVQVPAEN